MSWPVPSAARLFSSSLSTSCSAWCWQSSQEFCSPWFAWFPNRSSPWICFLWLRPQCSGWTCRWWCRNCWRSVGEVLNGQGDEWNCSDFSAANLSLIVITCNLKLSWRLFPWSHRFDRSRPAACSLSGLCSVRLAPTYYFSKLLANFSKF